MKIILMIWMLTLAVLTSTQSVAQGQTQLNNSTPTLNQNELGNCAYETDSAYLEQLSDPLSSKNRRLQQVTQTSLNDLLNSEASILNDSSLAEQLHTPQIQAFEGLVRIPLAIHILRRNDGSGGASLASLLSAIETVNNNYSPFNLRFEACNIRFIDSTSLFDTRLFFPTSTNICGDPSDGQQLSVQGRNIPNKINIYVAPNSTSRQAGNDNALCTTDDLFPNRSWTWRPSNVNDNVLRQHIVLNTSHVTDDRTLGHEVGHWFGLLHTHGSSNNRQPVNVETTELVDGSNCRFSGDFVCDTPADPNLSGRVDFSCNYIDNPRLVDANGSQFLPDTTNRMAYSRGRCRSSWSQEQGLRMQAAYLGIRHERGYDLQLRSCDIDYETASFVSQDAPLDMLVGQRYPVSVTFRNTGRSTWSPSYRLVSRENGFNLFKNNLSTDAVVLGRQVAPDDTVTVNFQISALAQGVYTYLWGVAKPHEQTTFVSGGTGAVEVTVAGEPQSCAELDAQIAQNQQSKRLAQAQIPNASSSDEKAGIVAEIRMINAQIEALERSKASMGCA